MRGLCLLALSCTASAWWKDEDTRTRGEVSPVQRSTAPHLSHRRRQENAPRVAQGGMLTARTLVP